VGEAPITLEEALQADEVFTSGTAVVVSPVGSLTHKGQKTQFGKPGVPGMSTAIARQACTATAFGHQYVFTKMHVRKSYLSWLICVCWDYTGCDTPILSFSYCWLAVITNAPSAQQLIYVCYAGPVATELYGALTDVQQEKVKDSYGWVFPVT